MCTRWCVPASDRYDLLGGWGEEREGADETREGWADGPGRGPRHVMEVLHTPCTIAGHARWPAQDQASQPPYLVPVAVVGAVPVPVPVVGQYCTIDSASIASVYHDTMKEVG
jgi:hypothetical protein